MRTLRVLLLNLELCQVMNAWDQGRPKHRRYVKQHNMRIIHKENALTSSLLTQEYPTPTALSPPSPPYILKPLVTPRTPTKFFDTSPSPRHVHHRSHSHSESTAVSPRGPSRIPLPLKWISFLLLMVFLSLIASYMIVEIHRNVRLLVKSPICSTTTRHSDMVCRNMYMCHLF